MENGTVNLPNRMDSVRYLESYGWKQGEALQRGGLKKPVLVKHKKDTKGLGHDSDLHEVWWEKVFDVQLKGLEVSSGGASGVEVTSKQASEVEREVRKELTGLYSWFVKGEGLRGTVDEKLMKSETVTIRSSQSKDKLKEKSKKDRGREKSDLQKSRKSKKLKRKAAESSADEILKKLLKKKRNS